LLLNRPSHIDISLRDDLDVASVSSDPVKRSNIQEKCTTTGLALRLLGNQGAIMFAWFMTDVVVFVPGHFLWLWVVLKRG